VFSRVFIEPVDETPDLESELNGGITTTPATYKVKFVKRSRNLVEKKRN
jgi:hypothetical protein